MTGYFQSLEGLNEIPSPLNDVKDEIIEAAREGRSFGDILVVDPIEGVEYWSSVIAERVAMNKDALILVSGPTGEGKSTLAMRLALRTAEILRTAWGFTGAEWTVAGGICYTALDLLRFYRSATDEGVKGRIAIVDEGAQAMFSGDNATPEVKLLIKAINLVRVAGCVVFLCVPDLMSIAKAMRVRLAHIWLAVRKRGLARCHVRDRRLAYKPETNFGFSVSTKCPHLTFEPFDENGQPWIDYLARKRSNLADYLSQAESEAESREGREVEREVSKEIRERVQARERQRRHRKRDRDKSRDSASHATPSPNARAPARGKSAGVTRDSVT